MSCADTLVCPVALSLCVRHVTCHDLARLVADPSERTDEVHIVASRVAGSEEDFAEDEAARAERKQHAYLALAEQLDSQIDIELLDDSLHGDSGTRHTVSPIPFTTIDTQAIGGRKCRWKNIFI